MFTGFSYLDAAFTLIAYGVFILYRIKTNDGVRILSAKALKRIELKSVAIILLLLSLLVLVVYNLIAAVVKYRQGYYVDPVTGIIITRPLSEYNRQDQNIFPSISVLLNLSWTLQCASLFLLMALWNHMSKAELNKQFMSSFEFKAYAIYSMVSLSIYPFLQVWYFISQNVIVSGVVPIFVYVFQCVLLLVLSQVSRFRFKKLALQLPVQTKAHSRIKYYGRMNNFLTVSMLLIAVGLGAIAVDAISSDMFFYNQFILDVFTKLYTLGITSSYVIAILILLPPAVSDGSDMSKNYGGVNNNGGVHLIVEPLKKSSQQHTVKTCRDSKTLTSPLSAHSNNNGGPVSPLSPNGRQQYLVDRDTRGFFKVQKTPPQSPGSDMSTTLRQSFRN
ncbi:hypothetical protein MP228_003679 [Amoeboaphelidium protococcarum]|nr:hypothetical protein MP228_003679 [Amoeboaphelidium protococcarum]